MREPPEPVERTESDSLGSVTITGSSSRDLLIGVNTVRGVENFPLDSSTIGDHPRYVDALCEVKLAACRANVEIGVLDPNIGAAIEAACLRRLEPESHGPWVSGEHFVVDMLEGSGGTSTNMNVNEVIANLALLGLGEEPGNYAKVHPNDHVNLGQSTNDVIPTALKVALHRTVQDAVGGLHELADALGGKRDEFATVLHTGRTCLQAAQPMTLGQAFGGWAAATSRAADELADRNRSLLTVPLGTTAIGTGLGAAPGYRKVVIAHLGEITGLPVQSVDDWFDGSQNADSIERVSAELRTAADVMTRIATDVMLLASAPDGRPELIIPAVQAGSSIMPGKVNPVIPITVQQASFRVFGNDAAVSLAVSHGQLAINHFEPLMAQSLFESARLVERCARLFANRCIEGCSADVEVSEANLLQSPAVATAFVPRLGYDTTSALVKRSAAEGVRFIDLVVDEGLLGSDEVRELLERSTRSPDD